MLWKTGVALRYDQSTCSFGYHEYREKTSPVIPAIRRSRSAGQSETGKGRPQLVEESRATGDCRGVGWIDRP
jgi:hypothetical protein